MPVLLPRLAVIPSCLPNLIFGDLRVGETFASCDVFSLFAREPVSIEGIHVLVE